jgi:hypothetical protein
MINSMKASFYFLREFSLNLRYPPIDDGRMTLSLVTPSPPSFYLVRR